MNTLAGDFMRQNTWANLTLIDFCESLDPSALDASVPGTYGRVRETLVHMVGSQERYVAWLTNSAPPAWQLNVADPWPGFPRLREVASRFGEELERLAQSARDDWQTHSPYPDDDATADATVVFVQAYNHCADHRSQIATTLSQAGIQPPELDGWAWGEAKRR